MATGVGVIGLGWSGFELHCQAVADVPELSLVAAADPDPALRRRAESELGIRTYDKFEDMLLNDHIELVSIAVPTYLHYSVAREALIAGKHVVVEKPLAMNTAEADELLSLAERNGLKLTVFNNRRWYPNFLAVRSALEEGEIGRPVLIEARVTFYGPIAGNQPGNWRNSRKSGGGVLHDWGPHLFDQILLLTGEFPRTAYCILKDDFFPSEADDYFKVILTFDSGLVAQVEMSSISKISLPLWHIVGTSGSISSEMDNIWGEMVVRTADRDYRPTRPDVLDYQHVSRMFYTEVAEAISNNTEMPVRASDARNVVRLIDYCLQSHAEGGVVTCAV